MIPRSVLTMPLALAVALLAASVMGSATAGASSLKRAAVAESYAHELLNCTRTGGYVRADGSCRKRSVVAHSGYREPLRLHAGISTRVALPWARSMVRLGFCAHSYRNLPDLGLRLRSSGYRYPTYGENIGCGPVSGQPKQVVLVVHRMMQAEMRSNGGHWRNIKSRSYKSVGIAVVTGNGRTAVVWDFYGKRY